MPALTERQYEVISYLEQEFILTGEVPKKERVISDLEIPEAYYLQCLQQAEFRLALGHRGIALNTNGNPEKAAVAKVLTQKQLAAIATMLDPHDTRSDKKKLQDMEIPSQTWAAWHRNPAFYNHYMARANALYGQSLIEAPKAIMDNVRRGDLASIKYVHEMTGFYSEKEKSAVDLNLVIRQVIDILTSEITDSATLERIATRLSSVLGTPEKGPALAAPGFAGALGPGVPMRTIEGSLNDL